MSAPEFVLEYLQSPEDLQREIQWERRAGAQRDLIRRIFGGINVVIAAVLLQKGFGWYAGLPLLLGVWLILWPYPIFWLAWLIMWFRGQDVAQPETRLKLELLHDGIRLGTSASPDHAPCFPWSTLHSVARDDYDYHFEFADGQRLHLPRSAFRTPAEDDWFLGVVQQRLPADDSAPPVAP